MDTTSWPRYLIKHRNKFTLARYQTLEVDSSSRAVYGGRNTGNSALTRVSAFCRTGLTTSVPGMNLVTVSSVQVTVPLKDP